ncbi:MAG: hypothetical protein LAT67_02925 [Balneolales bacterium]|nr:hypothetical protein [Balneolales bacterium]
MDFGFGSDLVPIVAILAVFGPFFYIIYLGGKLIKYRIDKKYNALSTEKLNEFDKFKERTNARLQALEAIISEQDEEQASKINKSSAPFKQDRSLSDTELSADESHYESKITKGSNSRLKNQLK